MTPRETLDANAEALEADQPLLADGLRSIPDEVIGGVETIELPTVDPARLKEFTDHIVGLGKVDGIILLGLGTPDMMDAVRAALAPDTALIVLEPGLELALKMLISADLSELFDAPFTGLISAPDDFELQRQIEGLVAAWGLGEMQMVVNPMRPLGEEIANLAVMLVTNAVESVQVASANVAHYGNQIIENVASNLTSIGASADGNALANIWAGKPAVVVGAGPSLDKDMEALKAKADSMVVIAVDAAAKALKDAGIPMDLVVTLDVIGQKQDFLNHVGDSLVVSLLGAHKDLITDNAAKRLFVSDEHPVSKWASAVIGLPVFPAMGNVAHLGYIMAKGAGCGKVCFVGVDFCLADEGKLYADVSGRGDEELSAEHKERLVSGISYAGEEVKTLSNMVGYAQSLAGFVQGSPGEVFNANKNGLRVLGIEAMEFEVFAKTFAQEALSRPLVPADLPAVPADRAQLLVEELGPLENELRAYAADASAFAENADRVREQVTSGEMSNMDSIQALSEGAGNFARHKGVMSMIETLQPAVSFEIARLTRQISAVEEPMERAQAQLFTLSGPAAGGAQIAETIADRLREAGQKMRS